MALFSVWAKEAWESRRKFHAIIRALRDETKKNTATAEQLRIQIGHGIDSMKNNRVYLEPYRRFCVSAWTLILNSGFLLRLDRDLINILEETYAAILTLNDFSKRVEEITFRPPDMEYSSVTKMIIANLEVMQKILAKLEKLEQTQRFLEKILDC